MSLDSRERRQTSAELRENLRRCGDSVATVAGALGMTADEVERTLDVAPGSNPVTVWRLRDHLESAVRARGAEPVPYTVLTEQMRGAAAGWFGVPPSST